jgi:hypothetical protein
VVVLMASDKSSRSSGRSGSSSKQQWSSSRTTAKKKKNSLGIKIEISAIDLIEAPEQILGRAVDVVAAGVVGKVVVERGARELELEEIDLVEEEDDAGAHEPARVDDRVEQHQAFHHPVLDWGWEHGLVVDCSADYG